MQGGRSAKRKQARSSRPRGIYRRAHQKLYGYRVVAEKDLRNDITERENNFVAANGEEADDFRENGDNQLDEQTKGCQ